MSEPAPPPRGPQANVLWGRVATAVAVVVMAFGLGRCTAGDGSEAQVADLEAQVSDLQSTNGQLRSQVQSLDEQLAEAPAPAPTSTEPAPTPTATTVPGEGAPGGTWTVQSGDTFYEIALRVYDDPDMRQEIAAANGLSTDATLQVGQVLRLPPAG